MKFMRRPAMMNQTKIDWKLISPTNGLVSGYMSPIPKLGFFLFFFFWCKLSFFLIYFCVTVKKKKQKTNGLVAGVWFTGFTLIR